MNKRRHHKTPRFRYVLLCVLSVLAAAPIIGLIVEEEVDHDDERTDHDEDDDDETPEQDIETNVF